MTAPDLSALIDADRLLLKRLRGEWRANDMVWPATDAMDEAADVIERLAVKVVEYERKQTAAAPAEPVAWLIESDDDLTWACANKRFMEQIRNDGGSNITPLYPAPAPDVRAAAIEEAARCCDRLAQMMEGGAGEIEPGERLRQAAGMIRTIGGKR